MAKLNLTRNTHLVIVVVMQIQETLCTDLDNTFEQTCVLLSSILSEADKARFPSQTGVNRFTVTADPSLPHRKNLCDELFEGDVLSVTRPPFNVMVLAPRYSIFAPGGARIL